MQAKRYAIVTGAASGLGRALSLELAQHGWHVAVADVNAAGSEETLSQIERAGGSGQVEHLDVTNPAEWSALAEKLEAAWPSLDLLVNNAGVGVGGEVGKLSLDDWRWIIDINLWGAIYGCHTLVDWLKANPRGAHIVNIASMAAIVSAPGMAPYNMTKAAMVSLSETLHGELKPFNIGVTAVCPSFFQTNIIRNGRFQSDAQRTAANKLMADSTATAEHVARQIRHAIERRRLYVMVPGIAKIFWWMKRLAPRLALNLVAKRGASGMTPAEKKEYARTH